MMSQAMRNQRMAWTDGSMSLEVLDLAFMFYRCRARFERTEISPPLGLRVDLA